jgi:aryl carrier-like protein
LRRFYAPDDNGKLIACIKPSDQGAMDTEAMRKFARTVLPEHMVPQQFRWVEEFPRTAVGKVDRAALQDFSWKFDDAPETHAQNEFISPRSETEATLAEIWTEVLRVGEISVHDDFYEIGGDSLLSIRILSRAHKAGLGISAEQFFANPTIAEQAKLVHKSQQETDASADDARPAGFSRADLGQADLDKIAGMLSDLDQEVD